MYATYIFFSLLSKLLVSNLLCICYGISTMFLWGLWGPEKKKIINVPYIFFHIPFIIYLFFSLFPTFFILIHTCLGNPHAGENPFSYFLIQVNGNCFNWLTAKPVSRFFTKCFKHYCWVLNNDKYGWQTNCLSMIKNKENTKWKLRRIKD